MKRIEYRTQGGSMTASLERDAIMASLIQHEEIIERGRIAFQAVGNALMTIRDQRLYRLDYDDFDSYCQQRWGFTRQRAHQLIEGATVAGNLSTGVDTPLPQNEAQTRELTTLNPDEQRIVWQVVADTAPDGAITAQHVRSVVNVLKDIQATGAIDSGTGQDIPVHAATIDHLKSAITEETYERMQRQMQYITERNKQVIKLRFAGLHTSDMPASVRAELERQGAGDRRLSLIVLVEDDGG